MLLTAIELRIIGSLIEKELTTPEYYPLSLNALKNACNQKSNRKPVMNISEDELISALDSLRNKKLVIFSSGQNQRVTKYKHNTYEALRMDQREISLIAALMLRGAQTLGELRLHTQRMHEFESLEEVQHFLQMLSERELPLLKLLPRQSGQKEQRYIHLLSEQEGANNIQIDAVEEDHIDEITLLKEKVEQLQEELVELKLDYYNLKKELGIT